MKIDVLIERGLDGTYDTHFDAEKENNLSFGLLGQGNTVEEAIADFQASAEEMKEYYDEIGKYFPENIEFVYKYDVPSFLAYYSDKISLAGLGRLTGINRKQLSHYLTGHSRPSEKTIRKIEKLLNDFGKELSEVSFV